MADRDTSTAAEIRTGTQVAATDLDTGETDVVTILNDYVIIADGDCYIGGIQMYPKTGTAVITVKVRHG